MSRKKEKIRLRGRKETIHSCVQRRSCQWKKPWIKIKKKMIGERIEQGMNEPCYGRQNDGGSKLCDQTDNCIAYRTFTEYSVQIVNHESSLSLSFVTHSIAYYFYYLQITGECYKCPGNANEWLTECCICMMSCWERRKEGSKVNLSAEQKWLKWNVNGVKVASWYILTYGTELFATLFNIRFIESSEMSSLLLSFDFILSSLSLWKEFLLFILAPLVTFYSLFSRAPVHTGVSDKQLMSFWRKFSRKLRTEIVSLYTPFVISCVETHKERTTDERRIHGVWFIWKFLFSCVEMF